MGGGLSATSLGSKLLYNWCKMISQKNYDDIQRQVNEKGFWEMKDEWRISTVTVLCIEKVERYNKLAYKVSAECDHTFICYCPTVARAIEFLEIFEDLIQSLWSTCGWASWITKTVYEE